MLNKDVQLSKMDGFRGSFLVESHDPSAKIYILCMRDGKNIVKILFLASL